MADPEVSSFEPGLALEWRRGRMDPSGQSSGGARISRALTGLLMDARTLLSTIVTVCSTSCGRFSPRRCLGNSQPRRQEICFYDHRRLNAPPSRFPVLQPHRPWSSRPSFGASAPCIYSRLRERIIYLALPSPPGGELIIAHCSPGAEDRDRTSACTQRPGGYIASGLAILDTMRLINSQVSTICVALPPAWRGAAGQR